MISPLNILEGFLEACSLASTHWVILHALSRLIFSYLSLVCCFLSFFFNFLFAYSFESNLLYRGLTCFLDWFSIHSIQNACLFYCEFYNNLLLIIGPLLLCRWDSTSGHPPRHLTWQWALALSHWQHDIVNANSQLPTLIKQTQSPTLCFCKRWRYTFPTPPPRMSLTQQYTPSGSQPWPHPSSYSNLCPCVC